MYKFIKKRGYYTGIVYEWNLPTGHSCPFAKECKVSVDRTTGKFQSHKGEYTCYAASAERFPGVRDRRWQNYEFVAQGGRPVLPDDCKHLRIHSSGDFFSQKYFDMWVEIAKENPDVEMWAYTKSLRYLVARLGDIPDNLVLNASWGGHEDFLIEKHSLKNARVYPSAEAVPVGMPIDYNDDWARTPNVSFALLDNMKVKKSKTKQLLNIAD